MGWTEREFFGSTPRFFFHAYQGHQKQEIERAHNGFRQARIIAYYSIAPHLDKGKRIEMRDIIWLPEDGDRLEQMVNEVHVEPENLKRFNDDADEFYRQWLAERAGNSNPTQQHAT